MAQSLLQIAQEAQKQLNDIVPGKVTVALEKNPATGKNELVGYYEDRGRINYKREAFPNKLFNIGLTLFVSYFAKRKDYIMASSKMQQLAFDAGVHPQNYTEFQGEMFKEWGIKPGHIKTITLDC